MVPREHRSIYSRTRSFVKGYIRGMKVKPLVLINQLI